MNDVWHFSFASIALLSAACGRRSTTKSWWQSRLSNIRSVRLGHAATTLWYCLKRTNVLKHRITENYFHFLGLLWLHCCFYYYLGKRPVNKQNPVLLLSLSETLSNFSSTEPIRMTQLCVINYCRKQQIFHNFFPKKMCLLKLKW